MFCLSSVYSFKYLHATKNFFPPIDAWGRSQWPHVLRRRSVVARLLRLWVRIPLGIWMSVSCECCVLSSRGLCDGLITRKEKSYWLWCVVVCDLETSWMGRLSSRKKKVRMKGTSGVLFYLSLPCRYIGVYKPAH